MNNNAEKKKNYLEHEIEVKYMDACLASSIDWEWFIDEIEQAFDMCDISSWNEFLQSNALRKVYFYFLRIVAIKNASVQSTNSVLNDIILIAKMNGGIIDVDYCKEQIQSKFGSLLLLTVWITSIINADNKTDYLYHAEMLIRHNIFQLVKYDQMKTYQDAIHSYCHTIDIAGFETAKSCLEDNLNCVFHPLDPSFVEMHSKQFLSVNCFNYQGIVIPEYNSWQEAYLLDMMNVSISDRKVKPMIVIGGVKNPNPDRWSKEVINQMKLYFSSDIADFVLETIEYVMYGLIPSTQTISEHCRLFVESTNSDEEPFYRYSSYKVLTYLFEDRKMQLVKDEPIYRQLISKIQSFENISDIVRLSSDSLPLSKAQKQSLYIHYSNIYKEIDHVDSENKLLEYLRNPDMAKQINLDYFFKVTECFNSFIEDKTSRFIPSLFYEYMRFLLNVNSTGMGIDKRFVRGSILAVQDLWTKEYYEPTCSSMHMFEFKHELPSKDVERFADIAINRPLSLSIQYAMYDENSLLEIMKSASENPIHLMTKRIRISQLYPVEDDGVKTEKREIDRSILEMVEKITEEKGYVFLNRLAPHIFLTAIYERDLFQAQAIVPFIGLKECELYQRVSQKTRFKLVDYSTELSLAHITQLFPELEFVIRDIAKESGYVPFCENEKEFMKYKDPSSVLREILMDIFKVCRSFENAPDLLMAYNYMYNSNSLNIRNECIHGRNYIEGNGLRFAFRITLLILNMLYSRLELLKKSN